MIWKKTKYLKGYKFSYKEFPVKESNNKTYILSVACYDWKYDFIGYRLYKKKNGYIYYTNVNN